MIEEMAGRLLVGGELAEGRLTLEGGHIRSVDIGPTGEEDPPLIAPGLIDLHVHGYGGCDPLDDLAGMALALARAGTTAFQPTLFPAGPAALGDHAERVWAAAERDANQGSAARVVGLHLEGPFVNPARAGALPPEALAEPSVEALRRILGPATGGGRGIRTVTLAPELPGSADLIEEAQLPCQALQTAAGGRTCACPWATARPRPPRPARPPRPGPPARPTSSTP